MYQCQDILKELGSEHPEVLREAAFDAGEQGCEGAVDQLASLLASGHVGVQEASEIALRKIGGSKAIAAIIPFLRSDSAPIRNMSMDILREIGNQDLESLTALLHDDDADIRIFSSDILGSSKNVAAVAPLGEAMLKDPEVNVRYQAAVSLGELGFGDGAPYLNKAMQDDEWVQFSVIEALAKIKDDASVGALVGALDKSSDLVAGMIVDALGQMGNVKAVSLLMKRLDGSNADVGDPLMHKTACAVVLILDDRGVAKMNPLQKEQLRIALLDALGDEETEVQDTAVRGLAALGGDVASEAILSMAATMAPDSDRRELAVAALAQAGVSPALEEALAATEQSRAEAAIAAASRMDDPQLARAMITAYPGQERDIQRLMVDALGDTAARLGSDGAEFFRGLLSEQEDGHILKAALRFLGTVSRDTESGEAVFSLIHHEYDDVKEAALEACASLWDGDMALRFEALSRSQEPIDRLMAIYVIGKAGDTERVELVGGALQDEVPDIRKVAVEALSELRAAVPNLVEVLSPSMEDEHSAVRLAVVEALGSGDVSGSGALLMRALEDEDDWVRIRAMEALAAAGRADAVPAIAAALQSGGSMIVVKALEALTHIGGAEAQSAIAALTEHDDPSLREAAQEALQNIKRA